MPRGVTPIAATHRLDIEYLTGGLTHKLQLRCTAVLLSGVYHLAEQSGSTVLASTAATYLGNKTATIMPSTCVYQQYVLYTYVSGVYHPVESAALTVTPSAFSDIEPTGQWTLKMRDIAFNPVNFVLMGAGFAAPQHATPGSAGGVTLALANDLVSPVDGTIGAWLQGRAGLPMRSFGLYTVSLNRKSRRRLHLA
jgi:hypothetical protein